MDYFYCCLEEASSKLEFGTWYSGLTELVFGPLKKNQTMVEFIAL